MLVFFTTNFFSGKVVESGFITANKNQILIPIESQNKSAVKNNTFLNKPNIKLAFKNPSIHQSSTSKKRKNIEDLDNQNHSDTNTILKKHDLKFDNCTFNNCVFNVSSCDCNKENE